MTFKIGSLLLKLQHDPRNLFGSVRQRWQWNSNFHKRGELSIVVVGLCSFYTYSFTQNLGPAPLWQTHVFTESSFSAGQFISFFLLKKILFIWPKDNININGKERKFHLGLSYHMETEFKKTKQNTSLVVWTMDCK